MKIVFDSDKDAKNKANHGISLADAGLIEWDTLWVMQDTRKDYGECRMIGYAYIGERLFSVVYVDREDCRRIISLRKANSREIKRYAEA